MSLDELLQAFDHHDPKFLKDPTPVYAALRNRCPVAHTDRHGGFWLVSRYEDIRTAAKDWETFTSSIPNVTAIPSSHPREHPDIPNEIDPPLHTRYRQLIAPVFARHRVQALEPKIRELAAGRCDAIVERGGGDVVNDLAVPLSVGTLAEFMNLPAEDRDLWAPWVRRMFRTVSDPEDAEAAHVEYVAYVDGLIAERRRDPKDDFLSMLLTSEVEGNRLSDDEVKAVAVVLFIAGHDTTASGMGWTLHFLAENPAVRRRLTADPTQIPTSIEEFLRLSSPVLLLARNATREVELHGETISSGDVVALVWASGNRDERAFPEPNRCILDRSPNRHLAFGFGPHTCVGAHIARLEMSVMLEELLARIPEFELCPDDPPRPKQHGYTSGFDAVPILVRG